MRFFSQASPFNKLLIGLFALVLACGLALPTTSAHAVTAAEMAAEADAALSQLHSMEQTMNEASDNYFACLFEYQEAIDAREETEARIDDINERIDEVQNRLGTRAREMYRNGSSSFLDLILGATSFEEFAKNWDLMNRVNETDAELSVEAKDLRSELEAQKALLQEQEKTAQEKSNDAARAYDDAKVLYEQMEETYNALSAEAQALYAAEQQAAYAAAMNAANVTGGVQNDDGTVTDIATGQVYSNASEYVAATGNAIVDRAMAMLGHGYQYGATGSNGYFDCSGFVSYALTGEYNRIGWTGTMINWPQVTDPQPGDICVIHDGENQHTGIYIGNGQMIHAADENTGVIISDVQKGMIYVRY